MIIVFLVIYVINSAFHETFIYMKNYITVSLVSLIRENCSENLINGAFQSSVSH